MQIGDSLFDLEGDPELKSARFLNFLLELKGIGSVRALQIAQSFMTVEQVFAHLTSIGIHNLEIQELPEPESEYQIQALSFFSDQYPAALRELPNPPAILWVVGNLPEGRAVSTIGTRHPTAEAVGVTEALCKSLSPNTDILVSGLAEGVDSIAHVTSLNCGIKNIAVLGHGFLEIRRSEKWELAQRILENGGALVSEYAPHKKSTAGSFIARDRIIAALGLATVVIQCGVPSGTLHTVRDALNLGRKVLVIDQSKKSFHNLGNQYLLGQGVSELTNEQSDWLASNRLLMKSSWRNHIIPIQTPGQLKANL